MITGSKMGRRFNHKKFTLKGIKSFSSPPLIREVQEPPFSCAPRPKVICPGRRARSEWVAHKILRLFNCLKLYILGVEFEEMTRREQFRRNC